jgi:hypothetical protein
MDKAYEKFNEEVYNPKPLPVHGIVKQAGFGPHGAITVMANPEQLIPSIFGRPLIQGTSRNDQLLGLPATDIAMIMGGTQSKNALMSKARPVKPPGILRRQGVKPVKPEQKRILDPSKVAEEIADVYRDAVSGNLPSNATLMNKLATMRKKSALGQSLTTQYETDPSGAMNAIKNTMRTAALGGLPDDAMLRAKMNLFDTNWANQGGIMARKPKKLIKGVKKVAGSYYG